MKGFNQETYLKGTEATYMKIVERMKKCFRMKDILDFNVS